ncbi:flavodoxin [Sphaerochaeta pleomorpha str. Grapes]|uniref:Flavodoxin n=1 Tax=Sphaerochaeta pleomorpha (strain ATCC BAA-1885 / DSM 22778 / Grapes) TaxID=158190 RepID=G8QUX4_SPHPG|nr:flavodoxin domain-containing protein [Sphaerochaeta pleomorpha]AEV28150.1 flavodoxin [Sphaerochaeta pleomorpha str. Grapes]
MRTIAVVYYSGTHNTEIMAKAIADSVTRHGSEAKLFTPGEFNSSMLDSFDSIAFGCPAMGMEVLEEEHFEPMFSEVEKHLKGKPIALFGSYGWGDGQWMEDWEERARADEALLMYKSIIAQEIPDAIALAKCELLGEILST